MTNHPCKTSIYPPSVEYKSLPNTLYPTKHSLKINHLVGSDVTAPKTSLQPLKNKLLSIPKKPSSMPYSTFIERERERKMRKMRGMRRMESIPRQLRRGCTSPSITPEEGGMQDDM
ncbi:hypothetical protein TNCV_4261301 [Trichonephila clavipes]|nr:hypothetical protein TNCV_4261301 [Trichonephila clavipes]